MWVKVRYEKTMEDNGRFEVDPETGEATITLAEDAEKPLSFIFGHETLHAVKSKSKEAYDHLKDVVKGLMGEDAWNEAVDRKRAQYERAGKGSDRDGYEEEVVGDEIGKILEDGKRLKELSFRLNHRVLSTIMDILKKIANVFRKNKMTDEEKRMNDLLKTVAKEYRKAVGREVDKAQNGGMEMPDGSTSSTKFSTRSMVNGVGLNVGKGVKYHRGGNSVELTKEEETLRDAVIDKLRENGMDVITDVEEGQRVLDEANGKARFQLGDARNTFDERQKQAVEGRGIVMSGLNEAEVNVVNGIPRHSYTGNIAQATEQAIRNAKAKYTPNGKAEVLHYDNYGKEFDYTISGNAIEICLSPKHQAKSENKGLHLSLAEHLDEIINNSIEVEEHPDYIKDKDGIRGENVNPNAIMHRFYGVAVIDGKPCRVMTLMREDGGKEESNGVHSYEVQKIEVLDKELPSTTNGVGRQTNLSSGYPLAKLLKGIEKAYDKGKYLLEESEKSSSNEEKPKFFRTGDGEAYGFTIGGKIYVNPRIAGAETPIHEYAHLWATAMRNGNHKEWKNIVNLMKGTSVWDEVVRKYPELKSEDDIADEVLSHFSGRRGAERLRQMQEEIAKGKGSAMEKADAISAIEKVKNALKNFWKGVADFLHIHYTSAEEVADRVMKDMLDGVDPRRYGKDDRGRKQFVGEKGAKNLDHAEEVNTRLDNLGVAREMEGANKDAKSIKLATGWERGADGKWRYETPDFLVKDFAKTYSKAIEEKTDKNALERLNATDRELEAVQSRVSELSWSDSRTEEESAELRDLDDKLDRLYEERYKLKADVEDSQVITLGDLAKGNELLKAYPEIGDIKVEVTNLGSFYAKFSPSDNKILINNKHTDLGTTAIVHELQHVIQRIEGFARGGTSEGIEREFNAAKAEWAARAYARNLEETAKELGDGYNQLEVEKAMIKEYEDMGMLDWLPDEEARIKGFNYFARGYADRSMDDAIKGFRLDKSVRGDFNPYLEYRKLGGEVEARNAQRRMDMSPEERRASLASETEDVSREDQIFLGVDNGEGGNYEKKEALETASLENNSRSLTVISSADGAKVLKNLDNLSELLENSTTKPKTFIGDVAKAIGATTHGSGSKYATFEAKNGDVITIRLANHNAHASGFDHSGRDNGISIVVTPKPNKGITNDGNAHIVEFYYDSTKLRRADGKPLAGIVRSIKQALYSGVFKDETGLAEREEINADEGKLFRILDDDDPKTRELGSRMTERVNELSEKLHTPVRFITSQEEVDALPTERQRKQKGSYNTRTGEVTI